MNKIVPKTTVKTDALTGVGGGAPVDNVGTPKTKAPVLDQTGGVTHTPDNNVTVRAQGASHVVGQRAGAEVKEANPFVGFSNAPDKLGQLLHDEITGAFDFTQQILHAFTFFGGARIKPDDPFFEEGKVWGEAIALSNVAAADPALVATAAKSGLFSPEAVAAASGAALGVTVGSVGAKELASSLAFAGGMSNPETLAAALSAVSGDRIDPADAKLLMTLTRTGAGPGMMEAVPLGVLAAKDKLMELAPQLGKAVFEQMKTQGSSIKVPWEPEPTPHINQLREFAHFLPRRLALTEQSAGFVVFPGGLGTLNELFEVMRADRPVALHSSEFWTDIVGALKDAWIARGLAAPEDLDNLEVFDGPAKALPYLCRKSVEAKEVEAPSLERALEMSSDIQRGLTTLTKMPTAVSFIGGKRLTAGDAEIGVAKDIAAKLAKSQIAVRAGGDGALLDAVSAGNNSVKGAQAVQALLLNHSKLDQGAVEAKADVFEVVNSPAAHKLLMYENTDAFVALPGGVSVFDEVFELACLMQCKKIPKRPLILVGKSFWQPVLDAIENVMLDKNRDVPDDQRRKTISDDDMQLFTVVDDPAEAARLVRKHRAQREVQIS